MTPITHLSLAAFPGLRHTDAARSAALLAERGLLSEPAWGALSLAEVQLVPQCFGQLDEARCDELRALLPDTRFRLHANVQVTARACHVDLANLPQYPEWLVAAVRVHRYLEAPAYTLHAGHRADATLHEVLARARRLQDQFESPVGVEGGYPTPGDTLLLASWDDYRQLLESGLPYVVDLSHLHIVATHSGRRELTLVQELLANPMAIEIHVSANDGRADQHQVCTAPPWWAAALAYAHPGAVQFSEGNRRRPPAATDTSPG